MRIDTERERGTDRPGGASLEAMLAAFARGEAVPCPECGAEVRVVGLGAGVHPGLYCTNGHEVALLEIRRAEESRPWV